MAKAKKNTVAKLVSKLPADMQKSAAAKIAEQQAKGPTERDAFGNRVTAERSHSINVVLFNATEPMTPSAIGKACNQQAVSNHLRYLEARGLVVNHGDSTYSRADAPWLKKPAKKSKK